MTLKDLNTEQLKTIAGRIGTSLGYMQQLKYGNRRPSPELAKEIELVCSDMGLALSRLELLYPEDGPAANTES